MAGFSHARTRASSRRMMSNVTNKRMTYAMVVACLYVALGQVGAHQALGKTLQQYSIVKPFRKSIQLYAERPAQLAVQIPQGYSVVPEVKWYPVNPKEGKNVMITVCLFSEEARRNQNLSCGNVAEGEIIVRKLRGSAQLRLELKSTRNINLHVDTVVKLAPSFSTVSTTSSKSANASYNSARTTTTLRSASVTPYRTTTSRRFPSVSRGPIRRVVTSYSSTRKVSLTQSKNVSTLRVQPTRSSCGPEAGKSTLQRKADGCGTKAGPTVTSTPTPPSTETPSVTPSKTGTASVTPTPTPPNTGTPSVTPSNSGTPSATSSNTGTPSIIPPSTTSSATLAKTATITPTVTPTVTSTRLPPSPSKSPRAAGGSPSQRSNDHTLVLVGGIVGGIAGLLLVVCIAMSCCKRKESEEGHYYLTNL